MKKYVHLDHICMVYVYTQQSPLVTFTAAQDLNSATYALSTYASQLLVFSFGNRRLHLNYKLSCACHISYIHIMAI
jgi:hypothetical protein